MKNLPVADSGIGCQGHISLAQQLLGTGGLNEVRAYQGDLPPRKEVAAFDDMVCHFVGAARNLVVCAELGREGRHDAPIGRERLVNGGLKFLVKAKSKPCPVILRPTLKEAAPRFVYN